MTPGRFKRPCRFLFCGLSYHKWILGIQERLHCCHGGYYGGIDGLSSQISIYGETISICG